LERRKRSQKEASGGDDVNVKIGINFSTLSQKKIGESNDTPAGKPLRAQKNPKRKKHPQTSEGMKPRGSAQTVSRANLNVWEKKARSSRAMNTNHA